METKRCFISGPMTGYPDLNKEAFFEAEEKLKRAGFSVFNPARLGLDDGGFTNQMILGIDLTALSHCNYIYQLDGWPESKGASAEWQFALSSGIKVVNREWLKWYVEVKDLEKKQKNDLVVSEQLEWAKQQACLVGCVD